MSTLQFSLICSINTILFNLNCVVSRDLSRDRSARGTYKAVRSRAIPRLWVQASPGGRRETFNLRWSPKPNIKYHLNIRLCDQLEPNIAVEEEEETSRGNLLDVFLVSQDEEMMSTKSSVSAPLLFLHVMPLFRVGYTNFSKQLYRKGLCLHYNLAWSVL